MTVSIKRTLDLPGNASQRMKRQTITTLCALFENFNDFFKYLSIADIGLFAEVSRDSKRIADEFFLKKAQRINFLVQTPHAAKQELQLIYLFHRTLVEVERIDVPDSTEASVIALTKLSRLDLFKLLSQLEFYKCPDQPLRGPLEDKRSWETALREPVEETEESIQNGYAALIYSVYFKCTNLTKRLLHAKASTSFSGAICHPYKPRHALPKLFHTAILASDYSTVRHLIALGADLNLAPNQAMVERLITPNLTVLQCALGSEEARQYYPKAKLDMQMVRLLLEHKAPVTGDDMVSAAESCSLEAVQLLMNHGGTWKAATAQEALIQYIRYSSLRKPQEVDDKARTFIASLREKGADVNAWGDFRDSAFHYAIHSGSLAWIQYLTSIGGSLSDCDRDGLTPLMLAIQQGSLEITRYLMEAGANVNQLDDHQRGYNALTYACSTKKNFMDTPPRYNNPEIVELLLSNGAKPLSGKFHPLTRARNSDLREIIAILEKHSIHEREEESESYSRTPMTIRTDLGNAPKRLKMDTDPFSSLLHNDKEITNHLSNQALKKIALRIGFPEQEPVQAKWKLRMLHLYLKTCQEWGGRTYSTIPRFQNLKIDEAFQFLSNPLIYRSPDHPMVELLDAHGSWIQESTSPEEIGEVDYTPGFIALTNATRYQKNGLTKRLLELGVDPYHALEFPSPLQYTILTSNFIGVKLLLAYKKPATEERVCKISDLQCAMGTRQVRKQVFRAELNLPMLRLLLAQYPRVYMDDLTAAATTCSIPAIKMLVNHVHGFSKNAFSQALIGFVKEMAKQHKSPTEASTQAMFNYLMENGARIDALDPLGFSALHYACHYNALNWVEFLADQDADMDLSNTNNISPLHCAAEVGAYEIICYLLDHHHVDVDRVTDYEHRDEPPYTALSFACTLEEKYPNRNDIRIVKRLLEEHAEPEDIGDYPNEPGPLELAKENGLKDIIKMIEEYLESGAHYQ